MNKLLVAAVAAGLLSTTALFNDGVAAADDNDQVLIVPGTAPAGGLFKKFYRYEPSMTKRIGQNYLPDRNAPRSVVPYPGAIWPVTGMHSPTLGQSLDSGATNLDAAIKRSKGPTAVTGLSQGTFVLDEEQARLAHDPAAPPPGDLTFIKAGDPGRFARRVFKVGKYVPILNYTVAPPVDSQYDSIEIASRYDLFSNPPTRFGNPLADINAFLGIGMYAHTKTAFSDPATVPPEDITVTRSPMGGTTTRYLITTELPIIQALVEMGHLPPESVGPLSAVLHPMIDSAYGPKQPGGPFGQRSGTRPGEIIPAITIPLESTFMGVNAGTSALTGASSLFNIANLASKVVGGAGGAKSALPGAATSKSIGAPKVGPGSKSNLLKLAGVLSKASK